MEASWSLASNICARYCRTRQYYRGTQLSSCHRCRQSRLWYWMSFRRHFWRPPSRYLLKYLDGGLRGLFLTLFISDQVQPCIKKRGFDLEQIVYSNTISNGIDPMKCINGFTLSIPCWTQVNLRTPSCHRSTAPGLRERVHDKRRRIIAAPLR